MSARWRARLSAGLLLVVLGPVSLVGVVPASAHTDLGGSTPSAGEVVRSVSTIELRFTGPVEPDGAVFRLRAMSGAAPSIVTTEFADDQTSVELRPAAALVDDRYRVGYQFVSVDGHPISGVLEFEVSRDGVARAADWAVQTPPPTSPDDAQGQGGDPGRVRPWVLAVAGAALVLLGFAVHRLDRPGRRGRGRPAP